LARWNTDRRNATADDAETHDGNVCEPWRFPIVDSAGAGVSAVSIPPEYSQYNQVTFVYAGADPVSPATVAVIGTFATLYEPIPLRRARFEDEETRFWSVTFLVPKGQVHRYRFMVDGAYPVNDPVNPQLETIDNGAVWSRFFTEGFSSPL